MLSVLVHSMKQVLFKVSFDGIQPSNTSASLLFPVDPSLSFESADEPDNWSTDVKFKLKIGVVSVTVEQHTEDRLQDSQSMLDLLMVKCDVVSAHSREDALECFSVQDALRLFSDRMGAAVNIGKLRFCCFWQ